MASTYTTNSGIEKPGTGEQSGLWGDTVNLNMDIIDRLTNGVGAISLSGTTHTLTVTDGALSDGQFKVLVLGGSPTGTNTITVAPNDADRWYIVKNSSGESAIFTQGSGGDVTVLNGDTKIIYCDGAGAGAAVVDITNDFAMGSVNIDGGTIDGVTLGTNSAVTEAQIDNININGNTISSTDTNGNIALTPDGTGEVDITKVDIDGGTIDGTVIGGASAAAGTFTTVTASGDVTIADKIVHDGDTNTAIRFPAADTVTVETGGTERVRINSSGNVGIGTSSPDYVIHAVSQDATEVGFQATGSGGGHWRLGTGSTISGFGGALRFYDMGAGAERMRIDSSGKVGVGTISPQTNIEVSSASSSSVLRLSNLTQSNSGDPAYDFGAIEFFTGDTGGIGARVAAKISAEADTASAAPGGELVFYSAATNSNVSERMRIESGGNVAIGNSTAGNARLYVVSPDSGSGSFSYYSINSSSTITFYVRGDGAFNTGIAAASPYNLTTIASANVFVDSSGFLYRSTSSIKYKTDVQDTAHGLAEVMALRPVTYKSNRADPSGAIPDTIYGGLIAEEVHEAGLTEFVQYAEDGTPDALHYGNMVSLCIKAIQEQQAIIETLKARVAALEA